MMLRESQFALWLRGPAPFVNRNACFDVLRGPSRALTGLVTQAAMRSGGSASLAACSVRACARSRFWIAHTSRKLTIRPYQKSPKKSLYIQLDK
jgi:hypothetical protein